MTLSFPRTDRNKYANARKLGGEGGLLHNSSALVLAHVFQDVVKTISAAQYFIDLPLTWIHNLRLCDYNRRIIMVRIMVCTGFHVFLHSVLCMVRMHGGANHVIGGALPGGHTMLDPRRDTHHRIPPVYKTETDRVYSFRRYVEDIGVWSMMTDLVAHQQCAAIARASP